MEVIVVTIVLLVIVGVIALIQSQKKPELSTFHEGGGTVLHTAGQEHSHSAISYVKKSKMLSSSERVFYHVLHSAVAHHYVIFTRVKLSDVLDIEKETSKSDRQRSKKYLKTAYIDFVLCEPGDLSVRCAIVLDKKTHQKAKQLERQKALDHACKSADLKLVRVKVRDSYSESEIIALLEPLIAVKEAELKQDAQARLKESCPKCNAEMLRKKITKGDHSGELFWCCSKFPTCKMLIAIPKPEEVKEKSVNSKGKVQPSLVKQ